VASLQGKDYEEQSHKLILHKPLNSNLCGSGDRRSTD